MIDISKPVEVYRLRDGAVFPARIVCTDRIWRGRPHLHVLRHHKENWCETSHIFSKDGKGVEGVYARYGLRNAPDPTPEKLMLEALERIISATQKYLHPDGAPARLLIGEVLAATDNPRIVAALTQMRSAADHG